MASPRTRRKLNSIRTTEENHVSSFVVVYSPYGVWECSNELFVFVEMFRVRYPEPAVGVSDVWDLDLPGVLGSAPEPRGAPVFRPFCYHG